MRNLVVLRAGPNSLHRNWSVPNRSWKLAISSFETDDPARFPEADYFHYFKGGKWDGIHAFFCANPDLLDDFDQFWLPDDDIDATPAQVETLFDVTENYKLELAQPSLTRDSYFFYPITLNTPFAILRYSNFVELMVPILNKSLLRRILPLLKLSKSGWGLDYVWSRMTSDPHSKCAIIDKISVRHTRPFGSALAKEIKRLGGSSRSEMDSLSCRTGEDFSGFYPLSFRLLPHYGPEIRGGFLCGLLQFLAQFPWRLIGRHPGRKTGIRLFCGAFYRQFTRTPNFETIDDAQIAAWLQNAGSPPAMGELQHSGLHQRSAAN